jgi:hypothetical protein
MYDHDEEWRREQRRTRRKIIEIIVGFIVLCVMYIVAEKLLWNYIDSFRNWKPG